MRGTGFARVAVCVLGGTLLAAPDARAQSHVALEAAGTAVVAFRDGPAIYRIDPATGAATLLSDETTGTGPLAAPGGIAVHPDGSLRLADGWVGTGALLRVDPVTGDRTVVSDATTGTGPLIEADSYEFPLALGSGGTHFVVDYPGAIGDPGRILAIDAAGNRTVVADPSTGSGPVLERMVALVAEAGGGLAVAETNTGGSRYRVVRVDPATGMRSLVSGRERGIGPLLLEVTGMFAQADGTLTTVSWDALQACVVLCPHPTCALCILRGPSVIDVDPDSGNRKMVSGAGRCVGDIFGCVTPLLGVRGRGPIVFGEDGAAVSSQSSLVTEPYGLYAFDRRTGLRRLIVDYLELDRRGGARPRARTPALPPSTPVVRPDRPRAWLRQAVGRSHGRFANRPLNDLFGGLSAQERRDLGARLYPALRSVLAPFLDEAEEAAAVPAARP